MVSFEIDFSNLPLPPPLHSLLLLRTSAEPNPISALVVCSNSLGTIIEKIKLIFSVGTMDKKVKESWGFGNDKGMSQVS